MDSEGKAFLSESLRKMQREREELLNSLQSKDLNNLNVETSSANKIQQEKMALLLQLNESNKRIFELENYIKSLSQKLDFETKKIKASSNSAKLNRIEQRLISIEKNLDGLKRKYCPDCQNKDQQIAQLTSELHMN